MSNFSILSQAIVNVLQGVQQSGAAAFADITTNPSTSFLGTPAVSAVPSDSPSDYATNVQNFRHYGFFVDIYLDIQADGSGMTVAFPIMLTLVDSVLDAFDQSNTLSGNCQILRPAPSAWSLAESADSVLLTARIILDCGTTVITNNG